MTDVVVVGSGASAVHAARALADAGRSVLVLDVGHEAGPDLVPDASFEAARRGDAAQHRWLLGDAFEGVPLGDVRVGAQLTPPRAYIGKDVATLTPLEGHGFSTLESLALGGLAAGWGAGVARFVESDLEGMPIGPADLAAHYESVEREIGTCGAADDLSAALGEHADMMPPLPLDTGSEILFERYRIHRQRCADAGLRLGPSRLAACSVERGGRGPHALDDLDFYADKRRAAWRPRWTLDALRRRDGFAYRPGRLVEAFERRPGGVAVRARALATGERELHEARAVVLAAGVLGTARIVLRSLGLFGLPLPLACNPMSYAACVNLGMLGKEPRDARHSLSQLTASFRPPRGGPDVYASVYSYRSLLTFKLMKEAPLPAALSRRLLPALVPLLTILGIQHADEPTPAKFLALRPGGDGPDVLVVRYALSAAEQRRVDDAEAALLRAMRRLGCIAVRRSRLGHGASIHLGGTLPMRERPGELQCDRDGRLGGREGVVIADGSLLPRLPAKALTLTLMANGHRVGARLAERLA